MMLRALRGRTEAMTVAVEPMEPRRLLSTVIDLRVPGGGKTVNITNVGQIVRLQVWAVVRGANSINTDEGFQSVMGSFLSRNLNGGAAKGKLAAVRTAPFNAVASSDGASVDLDRDGDRDVGSNDSTHAAGFFAARSAPLQRDGYAITGGRQFKIADLKFTVQILLSGGTTQINYRPRTALTAGVWMEDGRVLWAGNSVLKAGTPVTLRRVAVSAQARSAPLWPQFNAALGNHRLDDLFSDQGIA